MNLNNHYFIVKPLAKVVIFLALIYLAWTLWPTQTQAKTCKQIGRSNIGYKDSAYRSDLDTDKDAIACDK